MLPSVGMKSFSGLGLVSGRNEKLHKRLKAVRSRPENQVCADCGAKEIASACILENPVDQVNFRLGLFSCQECSTDFNDLGADVCQVKNLESGECKF